ncbi:MAG: thioether cross-link-forming SCIFF peptide maturase [Desulfurispora sp.]|uniref:thioether cross-link-forming SCIFF peptide maturase n=1 Tax=Desulfurispora sp. TaxID=3014275 RepID=UPI00404B0B7A
MIHKFTFDGTHLVLDVHSGALHQVDALVYAMLQEGAVFDPAAALRAGQEWLSGLAEAEVSSSDVQSDNRTVTERGLGQPRQDKSGSERADGSRSKPAAGQENLLSEALAEIQQLIAQGLLYSSDPLGGSYEPPPGGVVKALCLHLAHDCNLACRYCFAGQGAYGGPAGLMSAAVGQQAIDFLLAAAGSRRHVEVDFFGGEPLLNKPVLYELVPYGQQQAQRAGKQIKFTLTTNALLLDRETADFLNRHEISVVLSHDGRPAVHDRMRPFPSGAGSAEPVRERMQAFLAGRDYQNYYVRGTYTAYNTDFASDVIYLIEQGFTEVSVEPVVAPLKAPYALCEEHLPELKAQYEILTRYLQQRRQVGRPVNFFHFNIDLEGGPCLAKRLTGCAAGVEYLAVAPDGGLYPCHQFAGREDYRLGDVWQGVQNRQLVEVFRQAHIYHKPHCLDCWARYYCSGGCHASAINYGGHILAPYPTGCELARKRLECALYLKAQQLAE